MKKDIQIRIAKIIDLKAIVDIYNQAISVGEKTADVTPLKYEDRIKWFEEHGEKYPIYVAELNNIIVGWVSISAYRPGRMALSKTAEISYYIHFDYHRLGIGTELMQYAIKKCPSLGITSLIAILLDVNKGSIYILEKFGFSRWGHLPEIADFNGVSVGQYIYGLHI